MRSRGVFKKHERRQQRACTSCTATTVLCSPVTKRPLCSKCQQLPPHRLVRLQRALRLGYCLTTLRAEGPHATDSCSDAIASPLWLLSRLEARVARDPGLFQPARAREDAATLRREKRDAAPAFDLYRKLAVEAGVHQAMLYGPHSVAVGRGLIAADQGLQFALGGRDAWSFIREHAWCAWTVLEGRFCSRVATLNCAAAVLRAWWMPRTEMHAALSVNRACLAGHLRTLASLVPASILRYKSPLSPSPQPPGV